MKQLFDDVSIEYSRVTTRSYSTSFSIGIWCLSKELHDPIYAIYGFVRFADEIVDTFHDYNKKKLLDSFRAETYVAIEEKISLNPILNSFRATVHTYSIEMDLIDLFLRSMEMDLMRKKYDAFYGMLLIVVNVSIFEWLQRKSQPGLQVEDKRGLVCKDRTMSQSS